MSVSIPEGRRGQDRFTNFMVLEFALKMFLLRTKKNI